MMNSTTSGGKVTVAMLTWLKKLARTMFWLRQVKTVLAKLGLEPISLDSHFCALSTLVTAIHEFHIWAAIDKRE